MNCAKGDRIGATRGKLALVGVLAAVLVCVLASNFRGSAEAPPIVAASSTGRPESNATVRTGASSPQSSLTSFGEFSADGDWPHANIDKLITFDPLAAPTWATVGENAEADAVNAESANQTLEEIQQAQNAIIFITGGQRIARIGTQDYHVGDMVGRFQITDISSAGLVLSEPVGDAHDPK